jgi:hypothetical protein
MDFELLMWIIGIVAFIIGVIDLYFDGAISRAWVEGANHWGLW